MGKKRFERANDSASFTNLFGKRAQVTVFIILGIILLMVVGLVILMQKEVIKFNPTEIMPSDKGKVEVFISSCIEKIGDEALMRVGLQGGYVNIPAEVSGDGNLYLALSPMTKVPYWAYGVQTRIPSIQQVKAEIDQHLEDNLQSCLFSMQAFQEQYNLAEKSPITSDTVIVDAKVLFQVHWNVEVRTKSGEMIAEIIDHTAESPVKLKRVYDASRKIIEKEMVDFKFEDITQDLIALEHPDVPVAGIEISCSKKEWEYAKVKFTVQELLRYNIGQLKVKGTDYVEFPPELTYYQNHYIWNVGEEFKAPEIRVQFNYEPTYPFSFAVTPLQGTKLKSSSLGGTNILSFLCIQNWKFTYDVTYPVLVEVTDETTGYVFNTALTVHLVRNFPNRAAVSTARPSYFISTATDERYCSNKYIPMTVSTYELVENVETGIYNREPLIGVNTSITCLRYRCEMGQSLYDFQNRGDIAGYTQYFPYCVGGIIRGEKEGYKEDWKRVATKAGTQVDLNLVPLLDVPFSKIKVLVHDFSILGEIGPARTLSSQDVASIRITYVKPNTSVNIPYHDSSLAIAPRLGDKVLSDQKLQFLAKADYSYNLDLSLIENEELVGGYKQKWNVPWDEIETAQEITFHVLRKRAVSDAEAFYFIMNLENESALLPVPEIK